MSRECPDCKLAKVRHREEMEAANLVNAELVRNSDMLLMELKYLIRHAEKRAKRIKSKHVRHAVQKFEDAFK